MVFDFGELVFFVVVCVDVEAGLELVLLLV